MFDFNDYNKGTKYLMAGNIDKGMQFLKRATKVDDFKELWLNLGNCYKAKGDYVNAKKCYDKAIQTSVPNAHGKFGNFDLGISNMGLYYYATGNDDLAIEYYKKALVVNPNLADATWNYASALLRKYSSRQEVDLELAWKCYDYRFIRSNPVPIEKSLPMWDGVKRGRSICVLAEQGLGDKLMWGRYVKCLRAFFDEVWVQCPVMLDCIFSDFKTCRVAADSGAEFGTPICGLAGIFGLVDEEWLRGKFSADKFSTDRFNVGVEWAGSTTHSNNLNRSITPDVFLDNLSLPRVSLYTFREKSIRGLTALNTVNKGWDATASALLGLDLLITVDTSIAHMAGSLGVETWLLQPLIETDFRWGNNSMGEDNIWYPSVKVIRNPGDWKQVFSTVKKKLEGRAASFPFTKWDKAVVTYVNNFKTGNIE